jgi:alkylated DNA repair dioxygenase AlkB
MAAVTAPLGQVGRPEVDGGSASVDATAFQGSLFGGGDLFDGGPHEFWVPALPAGLTRTVLDHGAWIDVRRGWLTGADAVYEHLRHTVPWQAQRRPMYDRVVDVPRLLCFYDEDQPLPHPALTHAKQELDRHYLAELGEPFRTAGLCLYRDGHDSVAWHGDTIGRGATTDTMVAIVSVGSPRALLLRARSGGNAAMRFELGHGDLLVMGGSCQRTWEHAVPKTARTVGARISIQFRPRGVR